MHNTSRNLIKKKIRGAFEIRSATSIILKKPCFFRYVPVV